MWSKLSKYLLIGLFTIKQPFYSVLNQPSYNPEVSVFIEESISQTLTYKSWSGIVPSTYATTDQNILYSLTPNLRIGTGIQYNRLFQSDTDNLQFRGVLEYKLW